MGESLTLGGSPGRRFLSFIAGIGMIIPSAITVDHFYAANYPESIYEGSVCDISAFLNCDSSAGLKHIGTCWPSKTWQVKKDFF